MSFMSLIGVSCQICALPMQHTHYVPTEAKGFFEVYSPKEKGGSLKSVFPFENKHSWLLKAVALPLKEYPGALAPALGFVDEEGGNITAENEQSFFVGDGLDSYAAVHERCWQMAGCPSSLEPIEHLSLTYEWVKIKHYHGQLFEFASFMADEKSWMLEEPKEGTPSYQRIQNIIKEGELNGPFVRKMPFASAEEAVKANFWALKFTGKKPLCGYWRYRLGIKPEITPGLFDTFFQSDHEFKGDAKGYPTGKDLVKLEEYEFKLRQEIESNGKGILLLNLVNRGQMHFIGYTSDIDFTESTTKRISREIFGQEIDPGTEKDPEWKIYFTEFYFDSSL